MRLEFLATSFGGLFFLESENAKVCFLESGCETSEASYGSALDACFGC